MFDWLRYKRPARNYSSSKRFEHYPRPPNNKFPPPAPDLARKHYNEYGRAKRYYPRKTLDRLRDELRHERTNSAETRSFNLCNIVADMITHIENLEKEVQDGNRCKCRCKNRRAGGSDS